MSFSGLDVYGDSIAKGVIFDEARGRYTICRESFMQRLSKILPFTVKNYSVMGQTSDNGLARMTPDTLIAGDVAAIEYGGNDCDLDWKQVSEHPEVEQFGRVPIERFDHNLCEMVARARQAEMEPVLVTPPPLIAQRYFDWVSKGLNPANILKYLGDVEHIYRWQDGYAQRVREVAARLGVYLVDVRARMLAEKEKLPELMCVDGIHPNAQGHELIFREIAPLLEGR